ncbi:MAG: 5-deoxy-glucuronate isomerase [Anaerolineales bacterium]|nr:5-deoxy-glucuronate isomerase [Anaerolineales bacterium]
MSHHLKPNLNSELQINITPASAGWRYLSFSVRMLPAGRMFTCATEANEMALVPLSGEGRVTVEAQSFQLARESVFAGRPHVLYIPPWHELVIEARSDFEFALGGAPAEGKYPLRLFRPEEMKAEMRGGGAALRQVNHILAAPLPAERLILFEVYVPGGTWSGWPPHCHDGYAGSPYLEEVYYYRFTPTYGFGIHRNYRKDETFDEVFAVRHGEAVLVTKGFHPSAASPGSNMYFLNYLAGDLYDEARATPPVDDSDFAWMKQDWEGRRLTLPRD